MNVLVTGGAGFIGSHTCVELLNKGYGVIVVDNLVNSCEKSLERVQQITGKDLVFYENDVRDRAALDAIFEKYDIDSVIHFAGLKAVGESVEKPWEYYDNNIGGTLTLVDVMCKHNCKNIIFHSNLLLKAEVKTLRKNMIFSETICNILHCLRFFVKCYVRAIYFASSWSAS